MKKEDILYNIILWLFILVCLGIGLFIGGGWIAWYLYQVSNG
ncbi:MAG: hypothetical protein N4A38_05010 [Candidatus Gracilibacteria bacterium]|nr:hypothetical protein [Candidatus Gracilibacteria bacterium]